MKKISIVNNKGGCGKTTTVFNLAHYFAKQGLKTLAVDTDPQLNLSTNFGVNINELNFSLRDYLLERANGFQPEMLNENLYLISADPEAEKDMEELKNQGPYYYQLLNNFLENYDVVIFDTSPAFNAYTTSAIYTSSVYPVILPGVNELLGLNATINFTQGLEKDISGIEKEKLIKYENDITFHKEKSMEHIFKYSKAIFEANQIFSNKGNGFFGKWIEKLGVDRDSANVAIRKYSLYLKYQTKGLEEPEKVLTLSNRTVKTLTEQKKDDFKETEIIEVITSDNPTSKLKEIEEQKEAIKLSDVEEKRIFLTREKVKR